MSNASDNSKKSFQLNSVIKKLDINALLTWAVDAVAVIIISMALTLFAFDFLAFEL